MRVPLVLPARCCLPAASGDWLRAKRSVRLRGGASARRLSLFAALTLLLAVAGCGGKTEVKGPTRLTKTEARHVQEGRRIEADPVAYLRDLCARCEALPQYRVTFHRQERLGTLVRQLGRMEQIRAAYRKSPLSIKFEWDSPDADYYESVYVEGRDDSKLIVRERRGVFPFPAQVRVIDPALPVKVGRSRNPITDFGLGRIARRILTVLDAPDLAGRIKITYGGMVDLEPLHRPAHHLHIEQPAMPNYPHTKRDFYIDAETLLPAGTDLYLPDGDLDARYRYADIDTAVQLSDADFRLSKGHPKTKG